MDDAGSEHVVDGYTYGQFLAWQADEGRTLRKRVEVLERAVRNQGIAWFIFVMICYLVVRALFTKGILAGKDLVPDG